MSNKLFNPCFEHCYIRFGKQYTPECDKTCIHAKIVQENKKLKQELAHLREQNGGGIKCG